VKTTYAFIPINRKYAEEWILEGKEAKIFNNSFGDPPEAAADSSTGETMLLRMPSALKRRIEEAAKADDVSMNAFMLRCIESCLRERTAG
jgi:predicted HicB family RNase H-like nuclease